MMKKKSLFLKSIIIGTLINTAVLLVTGPLYAEDAEQITDLQSNRQMHTEIHKGEATFFKTNGRGACLFPATPDDLMVAALNPADFNGATLCGSYLRITGPLGEVTVRAVDLCPGCKTGDLDLSPEAFSKIAKRSMGRVDISWKVISPELNGPIAYYFKDGSAQNVALVQVRNHRNPIAKLEYKNKAGQWLEIPRTANNYFEQLPGLGAGPFSFRVTDHYGHVLVDDNIAYTKNNARNGQKQFPPKP